MLIDAINNFLEKRTNKFSFAAFQSHTSLPLQKLSYVISIPKIFRIFAFENNYTVAPIVCIVEFLVGWFYF